MKTVKEVSNISGVSVRTLHYYDTIGLLLPTEVTEAGYRLYDEKALERLQTILLLRELRFPLREIRAILENPAFDQREALSKQIELLELQKERIEKLITLAREQIRTGGKTLDFSAFDKTKEEALKKEAKERWGDTDAFKESEKRCADRTDEEQKGITAEMMKIFTRFGEIKDGDASGKEAQELVSALQNHITENYYICTKPILSGLGQMYTADERFTKTIDEAGGEGTAAFVGKAIGIYCQ